MADRTLEGKVALVTGASRGIGAATAEALAAAGAHVILTARKVKDLEAIEEKIHQAGGHATIAPLDLTETDGIARLAAAVAERWDRLDVLIINAAMMPPLTPVTQINPKEFSQALTINVLATQALLAAFDPLLKRSARAHVIGVTSSVATTPRAYWAAYASSKAAFEHLLLSYGLEVERICDIRVIILDPGATRTQMRARAYPGENPQTVKAPQLVADRVIDLLQQSSTSTRERV